MSLDPTVPSLLYRTSPLPLVPVLYPAMFRFHFICQAGFSRVSRQALPETNVGRLTGTENTLIVVMSCFKLRAEWDLIPSLNSAGFLK